jgi:hypothetical protein
LLYKSRAIHYFAQLQRAWFEIRRACLVPAERGNFIEAVQVSHHYKCNPCGQVAWIEVENLHRAPREYLTRLLNADEVRKLMAIIRRAKLTWPADLLRG